MSDDITPVPMSKSEAWDLTDSIRTDLETAYDAIERAKVAIPIAKQRLAWQAMGYDSFEEYVDEEFGEVFQQLRIKVDDRMQLVDVLADSGMSNRQIAGTLGVGEATVRRDLRKITLGASDDASNEVDAAGQSVEEVGLIDVRLSPSQSDPDPTPTVVENSTSSEDEIMDEQDNNDRFADINFDALIISTPSPQIIETEPSEDTKEYFQPRTVEPSWSPPRVEPLSPPKPKAYDEPEDEFLAPPMSLQKVQDPNKDDTKHCKTCACNLLP